MIDQISPQNLADQAKLAFERGDYPTAIKGFTEAANQFLADGNALMTAEMKNNLCVAYLQEKKAKEALESVEGTDQIFAGAGDLRRQGMALANKAAALQALKRKEEAAEFYEKSAAVLEQAGESELKADVYQALAGLEVSRGKMVDAVTAMQSGLMGVEKPTLKQRILKKLLFRRLWK